MAELSRSTTSVWIWNYNEECAHYYPENNIILELRIYHSYTYTNGLKKYEFSICILESSGRVQSNMIKRFKAKNMEQAIRFVEKLIYKTYIVPIIWDQVKYNEKAYMPDSEYKTIYESI